MLDGDGERGRAAVGGVPVIPVDYLGTDAVMAQTPEITDALHNVQAELRRRFLRGDPVPAEPPRGLFAGE